MQNIRERREDMDRGERRKGKIEWKKYKRIEVLRGKRGRKKEVEEREKSETEKKRGKKDRGTKRGGEEKKMKEGNEREGKKETQGRKIKRVVGENGRREGN